MKAGRPECLGWHLRVPASACKNTSGWYLRVPASARKIFCGPIGSNESGKARMPRLAPTSACIRLQKYERLRSVGTHECQEATGTNHFVHSLANQATTGTNQCVHPLANQATTGTNHGVHPLAMRGSARASARKCHQNIVPSGPRISCRVLI
jgi:hypothetical protein